MKIVMTRKDIELYQEACRQHTAEFVRKYITARFGEAPDKDRKHLLSIVDIYFRHFPHPVTCRPTDVDETEKQSS